MDLLKLKNGSDIRGVALPLSNEEVNLTSDVIYDIVNAFYYWLVDKFGSKELKIAIGHDSRLSAEFIKSASIKALVSSGAIVYDTKLSTTPSMFMTTKLLDMDASIEITASHLPSNRNGLKFFLPSGGLESDEITEVLKLAESKKKIDGIGRVEEIDFMKLYSKSLVELVRNKTKENKPFTGLKISVDAGNGASGFYAKDVLEVLGADISSSQFLEPDGNFKNHIPNPENIEAINSIRNRVIETKSDLGIIFDTDGDRVGAIDKYGNEINRNRLIALISKILLDEKNNATIVTDSITSDSLTKFIIKNGGMHHRFKRGYKNVINEAIRLNNIGIYTPLAIETSGHAALMENYFLDDGAYLITRILIKMSALLKEGLDISDLTKDLIDPKEEKEIRMSIDPSIDFKSYGLNVIDELNKYAKLKKWDIVSPNYEGIRINFDKDNGDGWLLLRMSLHDPIMPLNVESNTIGGVNLILRKLYDFIKDFDKLDLKTYTFY